MQEQPRQENKGCYTSCSCTLVVIFVPGMVVSVSITLVVLFCVVHTDGTEQHSGRGYNVREYMAARQRLLTKEQRRALGARLNLTKQELILDDILLKEKKELMEKSRLHRLLYNPALSFFKSKPWMENTTTFRIIRKMPKGGALHLHTSGITSLEWLVKNITYRDYVYMCTDKDGFLLLNAFSRPPVNDPECHWELVNDKRKSASSSHDFDQKLRESLSFLTSDPLTTYSGTNKAWDRFQKYFHQVGVIDYVAIMPDYFRQGLQEFWEDNVQYIEFRSGLAKLKELNGTVRDDVFGAELFKNVTDEFVLQHRDFVGAKVIISDVRTKPEQTIEKNVKRAMVMREKFPDFILGYDLVTQEDPSHPLIFFLDALLYPTSASQDNALPYFFHAGETNWQGTDVDENLVDALLLNTTRIGHGFALAKHPELTEMVKRRGVAVEINPISNQLLGLVKDLRNHALVPLLADDFPLVVSSDDPATWEALPLTHDFFVAFMDLSGQNMGLAFLKQLAINSIRYSALNSTEKDCAMKVWQNKWDQFVTEAVAEFAP